MAARCCVNGCRSWLASHASIRPAALPSATYAVKRGTLLAQRSPRARNYAVLRAPKKAPSNSEIFNLSEIPLSSFEGIIARNGDSFLQLKPSEYYSCAEKFAEAVQRGSNPWSITLTAKDGFPPHVVHETACIMRQVHGPRSADAFATALWASASEAGYRPSTLSLARQLIRSGAFGRVPQLRKVEARFKQLVSMAKDPDALTAEGELLFEQGNYDGAVRVLQRALQVGATDFEWKPYCQLCLGKAYLQIQKRDEAREILESLSESGLVEADIELSKMLRGLDRDTAEKHIYSAACNGRADMFSHLAEIAVERAADTSDKKSKEESLRWAREWSKLADLRVEY
ncbi:hypothetical protein PT974_08454 [Cladobotryum mycophilum]|uniref:Tetratricopeptide-like helical n=1 Tax=Cladobotryum mycophilum TaxID=491253 RepID=A0ABR0SDD3_9HYPO